MCRAYISGPIDSMGPLFRAANIQALIDLALPLRKAGLEVVVPGEIQPQGSENWTHSQFLHYDIAQMKKCDVICFAPNWKQSSGARIELKVARRLGMVCIFLD